MLFLGFSSLHVKADTRDRPHNPFHTHGNRSTKLLNHLDSTKSNLWFLIVDHRLNSWSSDSNKSFWFAQYACLSSPTAIIKQYKSHFCLLAIARKKMFSFYIHSYRSNEWVREKCPGNRLGVCRYLRDLAKERRKNSEKKYKNILVCMKPKTPKWQPQKCFFF